MSLPLPPPLTPRMRQLVDLASQGMGDKEIAAELGVVEATVEAHWRKLRQRYDLPNKTSVVARLLMDAHLLREAALEKQLVEQRSQATRAWESLIYEGTLLRREVETLRNETAYARMGGAVAFCGSLEIPPRLLYMSASVEETFGYTPQEMLDDPLLWPNLIDPDHWFHVVASFQRAVAEGWEASYYRYRFRHKDGRWLWIVQRCAPIFEGGRMVAYSGYGEDVTDREPEELDLRLRFAGKWVRTA